jgi:hypothetical protein
MIKPNHLAALATLLTAPALAQTADPHAGHAMPGAATAPAPPMDHSAMPGMDHSKMHYEGMTMAPPPKGITRSNVGPAEAALQAILDALEVGNSDLAIARLAPGLKVVEDGVEESRAEYVSGHLAADIAYQKSVKTVLLERSVVNESPVQARIVSKLRMVSNRSDKIIDSLVDETAVLTKLPDGWKIVLLRWDSAK